MPKNTHAVALGRRGGKKGGLAKVRKGFAAMPAAEAKRIRALAAEARKTKSNDKALAKLSKWLADPAATEAPNITLHITTKEKP